MFAQGRPPPVGDDNVKSGLSATRSKFPVEPVEKFNSARATLATREMKEWLKFTMASLGFGSVLLFLVPFPSGTRSEEKGPLNREMSAAGQVDDYSCPTEDLWFTFRGKQLNGQLFFRFIGRSFRWYPVVTVDKSMAMFVDRFLPCFVLFP